MPDHAHLLARGECQTADLRRFVHRWKLTTGYEWKRTHQCRLWQRGYHDRVLRDTDDMMRVAKYVVSNPVRSGLVKSVTEYALCGSTTHTIAEIMAAQDWLPVSEAGDVF